MSSKEYIEPVIENKVKLARVAKGDITQQELADKVSCSRQTIHSIESGKFTPSVELALKIARELDVKVEEIFFLGDQK